MKKIVLICSSLFLFLITSNLLANRLNIIVVGKKVPNSWEVLDNTSQVVIMGKKTTLKDRSYKYELLILSKSPQLKVLSAPTLYARPGQGGLINIGNGGDRISIRLK